MSDNTKQTSGNNTNKSSTIKPGNQNNSNKNKRTNLLSKNINKITEAQNGLVNNNSKCNETLKVNFKPPKSNNNKNNPTDNSEGKMACIIS
jgi:hypothetical protein